MKRLTRRQMLQQSAAGFGAVAMSDILARTAVANPLRAKAPHYTPTAQRAVFIFLEGGMSQIDSYDYKPLLQRDHGKPLPASVARPKFPFAPTGQLLGSPFKFKRWGERGMMASDLFPQVNELIDELCFVHAMHHEREDHNTAKTLLHTGHGLEIRPPLGSWLAYGLGTENENLPAYIDIVPNNPVTRPSAFLPTVYGGTALGRPDKRKQGRQWENLDGYWLGQRKYLDLVQSMNREHLELSGADEALEAEIQSMELAFRMQTEAPEIMSTKGESKETMKLYGAGQLNTDDFGRALLMARRFLEKGVRFITIKHSTRKFGNLWDQHENLEKGHRGNANSVDKPIAGFLRDMKARGLLDDTLVLCGSEFGRTPMFEIKDGGEGRLRNGRDHNPHGYTMWMAGGGVKRAFNYGVTDDYGYHAIQDKVHMHDLHATILHMMGMDHTKLTYQHGGREQRLTDVYGRVVDEILERA